MAESNLTVAQILGSIQQDGYTIIFRQQKNKKYAIIAVRGKEPEIAYTIDPFNTRILKAALSKIKRKIEELNGTDE